MIVTRRQSQGKKTNLNSRTYKLGKNSNSFHVLSEERESEKTKLIWGPILRSTLLVLGTFKQGEKAIQFDKLAAINANSNSSMMEKNKRVRS